MEEVAVLIRKLCPAALGLWIGFSGGTSQGQDRPAVPTPLSVDLAQEPGRLIIPSPVLSPSDPSINQQMADSIAERLQRSGRLRGYRVDIRFVDGIAELSGQVADLAQRAEVVNLVQSVQGVTGVRDRLEIPGSGMVLTAQGPNMEALAPPAQQPSGFEAPAPSIAGGATQEPMSIMPMMPGGMPNPAMQQPSMPPNAWPTYAPYNNYSRVAYPTCYPYEAFPFIGPMYPFPKIPLGWRSVSLTWQDGNWFYGRKATGHDWWRIRYY